MSKYEKILKRWVNFRDRSNMTFMKFSNYLALFVNLTRSLSFIKWTANEKKNQSFRTNGRRCRWYKLLKKVTVRLLKENGISAEVYEQLLPFSFRLLKCFCINNGILDYHELPIKSKLLPKITIVKQLSNFHKNFQNKMWAKRKYFFFWFCFPRQEWDSKHRKIKNKKFQSTRRKRNKIKKLWMGCLKCEQFI